MRVNFVVREVATGLRRNVTMTVAMILTTAISLGLVGTGLLAADDRPHRAALQRQLEVQVSLTADISAADTDCSQAVCSGLKATLQNSPLVASVRYESQQQAYERYQQLFKGQSLAELVRPQSLPATLRVKLNDPERYAGRPRGDDGQNGVRNVIDQRDFLAKLFNLLNGVRNATIAVAVVQALAALLLISNTIQVAAFNRRDEIGIMRLVGASRWYTQLPFLLEAVVAGVVGAVLASLGILVRQVPVRRRPLVRDRQQRRHPADRAGGDVLWVSPILLMIGAGVAAVTGVRDAAAVRAALISGAGRGVNWSTVKEQGRKLIAQNRKARHDYSILDTYEAGLALTGTEVKSLRLGRASLVDGFATIDDGEVWLRGLHIPEYTQGTWTNHEPRRNRKLLLHRAEIDQLIGKTKEGGLTLVPLALYFNDGKVKVELALARGKQSYDKRQDLAKRDADREIARAYGRAAKGRVRELR